MYVVYVYEPAFVFHRLGAGLPSLNTKSGPPPANSVTSPAEKANRPKFILATRTDRCKRSAAARTLFLALSNPLTLRVALVLAAIVVRPSPTRSSWRRNLASATVYERLPFGEHAESGRRDSDGRRPNPTGSARS